MYTMHGWHIKGTPEDQPAPAFLARCGGPKFCDVCKRDQDFFVEVYGLKPIPSGVSNSKPEQAT
jgi:hypothetical protein